MNNEGRIDKIAGIDLPYINPDNRLRKLLAVALPNQNGSKITTDLPSNYWDTSFFNLQQVKIFQEASEAEQFAILQLTNRSLLEEAYFIEKAGVGYMAKMVLLAETIEERMLYGLFTADETIHLNHLSYFLPKPELTDSRDPFLSLLTEVIQHSDKTVLLFVLQVVLEGWGLSHYRRLAKECHHPPLAEVFRSFLPAEARHHSTGNILFNQIYISSSSRADIIDLLARFLFMVQVGPQNVLAAIEKIKGHLSRFQKIQILQELDTETHSRSRLQLLRSLMAGESAKSIVESLKNQGFFQPLPAHQCINEI
jgi:hypothetical protein